MLPFDEGCTVSLHATNAKDMSALSRPVVGSHFLLSTGSVY